VTTGMSNFTESVNFIVALSVVEEQQMFEQDAEQHCGGGVGWSIIATHLPMKFLSPGQSII